MLFRVGHRYIVDHADGTSNVFYVRSRTRTHDVLRDGHSAYRRRVRGGARGEFVDVELADLWARDEVDATHAVGYSESMTDQVWHRDVGIPPSRPSMC